MYSVNELDWILIHVSVGLYICCVFIILSLILYLEYIVVIGFLDMSVTKFI